MAINMLLHVSGIMMNHTVKALTVGAAFASAMFAQNQRQATIVGGGGPDRGKCTMEVVVDDVAQVEIRGATATLRTMSGQPAQWRRFECTGAMPVNPSGFRFSGVDGRGRQELLRDPSNGGVAVIQIQDKDGGSEGYTFDIMWGAPNGGGYPAAGNQGRDRTFPNQGNPPAYGGIPPNAQDPRGAVNQPTYQGRDQQRAGSNAQADGYPDRNRDRNQEQYRPNYRDSDYYRRYGHAFGITEAVRVCQQSVLTQATRRFRSNDIHFHQSSIEDAPGRQDWVTGTLDVHRGNREERFGFSCSVNFDNGQVRSAELDARPLPDNPRWH